jgi:OmpA-OmpF porin, OOP family
MSVRRATAVAACIAAAAVMSVASSRAQTLYLGAEGGWSLLTDQTSTSAGFPTVNSRFDSGFAVGGRAGYEMGPWRFEGEYAYRSNDLDRITVAGFSPAGLRHGRESHAIMANLLYDINLTNFGIALPLPITPHIGAGVGAVNIIDRAFAPGLGRFFDDDDWQFGYQAIAGFRYNVTPNIAFDLDYRYLATTEATFRVPGNGVTYRSGYETHNVIGSLVYRFLPPPPPPVAVPPAPVRPPPPAPAPVYPRGERG